MTFNFRPSTLEIGRGGEGRRELEVRSQKSGATTRKKGSGKSGVEAENGVPAKMRLQFWRIAQRRKELRGERARRARQRRKKRLFTHFCVSMLLKTQGRCRNKPTFKPTFGLKIAATYTKNKRKTNPPNPLLGPFLSVSY